MGYFFDRKANMLLALDEGTGQIEIIEKCSFVETPAAPPPVNTASTLAPKKPKKVAGGRSVSKEPGTRKRLTQEQTEEIENMLKGQHSVADICEKTGVSMPTVYVIKTRLKNQGQLQ